jgi:hypothetical protein
MTSYNQLVQAKYNYEAHLFDVNVKLQQMQLRQQETGKPINQNKLRDTLQYKAELEAALQKIMRQLEPYYQAQKQQQEIQQKIGPPPTMSKDFKHPTDTEADLTTGIFGLLLNRRNRRQIEEARQQQQEEEKEEE